MTQVPIPFAEEGRSEHQFSVNARQTLIRISVPNEKLTRKDMRTARALACLHKYNVVSNVVFFKKGELCICADKAGQKIDDAGYEVRQALQLDYTSDSGLTLVTMRNCTDDLFNACVPPGKELARRKSGQETRIVMQLKRKDETIRP